MKYSIFQVWWLTPLSQHSRGRDGHIAVNYGQSGLHSEVLDIQDYLVRLYLKISHKVQKRVCSYKRRGPK